jgi:RHS repeat-associated protein
LTADGTDDVSYTYDDTGNIATMTVGTATTTYIYDDADEMTSDGTSTFSYDENGNLTGNGTDSYTYDYRNMLTSATVGSTATTFAYDGDGVRASKDGTPYLYDRESGLPMMVDDGTNAYLQQDGALASIDGSDDPSYMLGDALGSVRGVTDDGGTVIGSADYNVFGSLRTGDPFALGFTGEQSDGETGLTYLRARYLNPAVGRFISADTVSPNAPGTQGYNPYAYVGNNPTIWVDPSGHSAWVDASGQPTIFATLIYACTLTPWCAAALPHVGAALGVAAVFAAIACALDIGAELQFGVSATNGCFGLAGVIGDYWRDFGSTGPNTTTWDPSSAKDAPTNWPLIASAAIAALLNARPCGTAGLMLDTTPGMPHVMARHAKSAPDQSATKPTGKFWTDSEQQIALAIRGYGLVGWASLRWRLEGTVCAANVSTGLQIGLDDHRDLGGRPSHCLRIVTGVFGLHGLISSYPVSDGDCGKP